MGKKMAGINQLLPFANGETPNVIPYDDWNALAARLSGFQSGIASSKQFNYILAQGGAAGYVIGQLVADYTTETATIAATPLYQAFKQAMTAFVGASPVIATGTITPRSLADHLADVVCVKDFGAKGDGITDDSSAINSAIQQCTELGKLLFFPAGVYLVSETIIIYAKTMIKGESIYSSVIKLADNANCNIVETFKFAEFNETGGDNTENYPDLPVEFFIKNISFDGNRLNNFNGGVTSTAFNGDGVLIYGRNYIIDNISIQNCAGNGFHSILRTSELTVPGSSESRWNRTYINHVYVNECSFEGFVYEGPADSQIDDIVVGLIGKPGATFDENPGSSLIFPGQTIDGFVCCSTSTQDLQPKSQGTCELGFVHSYSCFEGYCVRLSDSSTRITAENIHAEGGIGNMLISDGVKGVIDKISLRNNRCGISSKNPDISIDTSSGLSIGNIIVNRSSTDKGRTSVVINGRYVYVGGISIFGGGFPGNGIELNSNVHVGSLICSYIQGTNPDGVPSVGVTVGSGQSPIVDSLEAFNCDVAIENNSAGGVVFSSGTVQNTEESGQVPQVVFNQTPWLSALKKWGISVQENGIWKFPSFAGYVNCPIEGRGSVQTFTVAHGMWRTPNVNEIKVTPRTSDAGMQSIAFAVKEVDDQNVTLLVNIPAETQSAYNLDVSI